MKSRITLLTAFVVLVAIHFFSTNQIVAQAASLPLQPAQSASAFGLEAHSLLASQVIKDPEHFSSTATTPTWSSGSVLAFIGLSVCGVFLYYVFVQVGVFRQSNFKE